MSKLKYLNGAISVLKWAVLYPIDEKNSKLKKFLHFIWSLFFISSFLITSVQCVMFLVTNGFDMLNEAIIIMNSALFITTSINFFLFYINSNSLRNLVRSINEDFVDEADNGIEKVSMRKTAKFCNVMSYFWTCSVIASGFFTGLLPLLTGDRTIMPIPGWFPYDHTKTPFYELSYSWQMFCQINLGMIYGASDMIFPNMTLIIGQQWTILAKNFSNNFYHTLLKLGISKNIVLKFKNDIQYESLTSLRNKYCKIFELMSGKKFSEENYSYLSRNIQHHQMLLESCKILNRIMGPYLLTKVLVIALNTILIVFTLITSEDRTLVFGLACYALFGSMELFIYNYGGQVLIEKSDILWSVYESPWYLCGLTFQKSIIFVQMKLCNVMETKVGGYFTLSASTFISFIRCVFSYAAVLKEVA